MAPKSVGPGTTITEPGHYVLATKVDDGGGTLLSEACIRIEADDVVFDGDGQLLQGGGVSDTTGLVVSGAQNVTVKNVTLRRWDYGLRFEDAVGGQVRGVAAVDNGYGLSFERASVVVVRGCKISDNLIGVVADADSEIALWNTDVSGNVGRDVHHSEG